ncbi:TPA: hypothetical protein TU160_002051 [Streptococcus equi subsp. zooepidemicus]|nr:hypothetical protein [Streptococcus equi subsp. zooepidemicus]HEL0780564.1 hypothetical protein [Streptococcus equi subsp. zooepidemicus]
MKNRIAATVAPRVITKETMQLDFEYEMAQKLTRSMYEKGLISLDEMNRISALNKEKFYPLYGDLM